MMKTIDYLLKKTGFNTNSNKGSVTFYADKGTYHVRLYFSPRTGSSSYITKTVIITSSKNKNFGLSESKICSPKVKGTRLNSPNIYGSICKIEVSTNCKSDATENTVKLYDIITNKSLESGGTNRFERDVKPETEYEVLFSWQTKGGKKIYINNPVKIKYHFDDEQMVGSWIQEDMNK